ncbi:hypothetical protein CBL_04580 [Carabus blaptoides fortunei]
MKTCYVFSLAERSMPVRTCQAQVKHKTPQRKETNNKDVILLLFMFRRATALTADTCVVEAQCKRSRDRGCTTSTLPSAKTQPLPSETHQTPGTQLPYTRTSKTSPGYCRLPYCT